MDVMKPVIRSDWPVGSDWIYEVKYDGFRCVMKWDGASVNLTSKNKKDLTGQFPEVREGLSAVLQQQPPMIIDSELVILNNSLQGNFARLQQRSRMRQSDVIADAADERPAVLMAFDLLEWSDESLMARPMIERSQHLRDLIDKLGETNEVIKPVFQSTQAESLWKQVFDYKGEGLIAKRTSSVYHAEKQHNDWYKVKNWRTVAGALTAYYPTNNYFSIAVREGDNWVNIGVCKHGLSNDTMDKLRRLFRNEGVDNEGALELPPAIAGEIHTLDLVGGALREPEFTDIFQLNQCTHCTIEAMQLDLAMLPETVDISNTDKIFWPDRHLTKGSLLVYMREAAPYILPFLKQKALTIIRFPDGADGKHFFQKNRPDYAPDFFPGSADQDEAPIQCEGLEGLIWLANQGTIEYHVPFQLLENTVPNEIVFDLDPPERSRFDLAVTAADLIKQILDQLDLEAFVKTSGNKGLQVHIPLPEKRLSYDDTALFTEAVADTVQRTQPDLFTTERLKTHRRGRLYIDYVQHGQDKTIITPYSPRGTSDATVAAPLFWHELKGDLHPEMFTIETTIDRIHRLGCPFSNYHQAGNNQSLQGLLQLIGR